MKKYPFFVFQKNANVSIFVKANYLEKMRDYPSFSLWIPIALAKICMFRVVLVQKPLYLEGTVLNTTHATYPERQAHDYINRKFILATL